jgi:DNA-binding response OmpR family regulator
MRPKKVILCVDADEQRLSRRVFLLETRGYRVLRAASGAAALKVLHNSLPLAIDLLLTDLILLDMAGNELVRRTKRMHPEMRTIITSDTVSSFDPASTADVFLPSSTNTAELLERIRILMVRKRGPRKMSPTAIAAVHASKVYQALAAQEAACA